MLKNENKNEQDSGHEGESLKFEWHPVKAASNLKKHKVSFEEASSIFKDTMRVEAPDQLHSDDEQRYLGIGRSTKGHPEHLLHVSSREDSHHQRTTGSTLGKERI
jgi:uncharacterized DUF497 family protein